MTCNVMVAGDRAGSQESAGDWLMDAGPDRQPTGAQAGTPGGRTWARVHRIIDQGGLLAETEAERCSGTGSGACASDSAPARLRSLPGWGGPARGSSAG